MFMWGFPVLGCALLASALLLRRRPLTALAVLLGGSAVATALKSPGPASTLQIVAACAAGIEICYLAATRSRKVSVSGVAVAGAVLLILLLDVPSAGMHRDGIVEPAVAPVMVAVPLLMAIAWLIGNSIRQAQAQAQLVRAQAAAQTVMAERLLIAREVHDIVAHSIGIIAIQAGSGRRVFDACPDEARDALATIEATSRETLSGLRRMVTGLRRADPGPGLGQARLEQARLEQARLGQVQQGQARLGQARLGQARLDPSPGLAAIERLAATTLAAGVTVDVDWHGCRKPLPADIDASAFRIIQEAVTNVVRHAGTGQCRVSIDQQDGELSIEITDSGRGGGPAGIGYGITGMRERAALLGGDFCAGSRPGGGFRVAARLPLPTLTR